MVEGSHCSASGELPGAAAAGPAGSTGSSSMTRRCIFVVVSALLVVIFVKEGCLLLSYFSQDLPKVRFFQDLPKLSKIFQNLSKSFFSRRKVTFSSCFFQDLPRFASFKMFQNFPKPSRIFRKVASPKISWEFSTFFYFHDLLKLLLGAFLTFQKYSEILQEFFIGFPIHPTQGIDEEGRLY